jgi:succinyl-CoA synthetase beta subunit
VLRVSATGGVGFDAATATAVPVPLERGLGGFEITRALRSAGVGDLALRRALTRAIEAMWRAFSVSEATIIEVNPFRWDGERLVAVGVAVDFEDPCGWPAARYRPSPLVAGDVVAGRTPNPREQAVERANAAAPYRPAVRYSELDGDVAMLVIGGGAGLLALDRLVDLGLKPSCYVDGSPGATHAKFVELVAAGLGRPGVRGGIIGAVVMSLMDTQELARAIVEAIGRVGYDPAVRPLVVRLAGPHEEESRELLAAAAPAVRVIGRDLSLDDACDELARALRETEARR